MLSPKSKWLLVPLFSVAGLWIWPMAAPAQNQPASDKPKFTCAEMEQFLRDAKIGRQRDIPKGVTLPKRATLTSDDGFNHPSAVAVAANGLVYVSDTFNDRIQVYSWNVEP